MRLKLVFLTCFSLFSVTLFAQQQVLDRDVQMIFSDHVFDRHENYHNAKSSHINYLLDSSFSKEIDQLKFKSFTFWLWNRVLNESYLDFQGKDYKVKVDPFYRLINGRELNLQRSSYHSRKGIMVNAQIGKRLSFSYFLIEGPVKGERFLDEYISATRVLPGEGIVKPEDGRYGNYYSFGTLSYKASDYISFTAGHGKNFLGDGYRSLFLSDAAYSYPFAKMNLRFGGFVEYDAIVAEFIDYSPDMAPPGDVLRRKKYGSFHYLNFKGNSNWTFGFFEGVIWAGDSTGRFNLDVNYLNPFTVFRPVEYNLGSPDNIMIGIHSKYLLGKSLDFYGQFLLTEFFAAELFARNKWWGNKLAYQLGLKLHNLPHLKNFYLQLEYNHIKPYTYNHGYSVTGISHNGQALAHPSGSNLKEGVAILNYRHKRWNYNLQCNYKFSGLEESDSTSIGTDVLRPYTERPREYGVIIGQGIPYQQFYTNLKASYIINPSNMMLFDIGITNRAEWIDGDERNSFMIYLGLRTGLTNFYADF